MDQDKSNIQLLKEHVKDYVQTRVDIAVLTVADKGTQAVSNAALYFMLLVITLFFLLFASVAAAFAISDLMDSRYAGFLIIAGIYLLVGLLIFVMRDKWVINPIVNGIIKKIFKKDEGGIKL